MTKKKLVALGANSTATVDETNSLVGIEVNGKTYNYKDAYARQELVKKEDEITYGLSEEDEIETINGMGIADTIAREQLDNIANEINDLKENQGSEETTTTYKETSISGTTIELTDVGKTDIVDMTIEGKTISSISDFDSISPSNISTLVSLENFNVTINGTNVNINTSLNSLYGNKDILNLKEKKIKKKVKKITLTGEENWGTEFYTGQNRRYRLNTTISDFDNTNFDDYSYTNNNAKKYFICNYFCSAGVHFHNTVYSPNGSIHISNSKYLYIHHIDFNQESNTVDEFKAWLQEKYTQGNPVVVYYLCVESEENISIQDINLNVGNNIVTTDSELEPIINLTYYKEIINKINNNTKIFLLTDDSTEEIESITNGLILDDRKIEKNITPTAFHPSMNVNDVIVVGNTLRYYASIEPSYADQSCEWSCDNETKAKITKVGNGFACDVLGVSAGNVKITCTPNNTTLTSVSTSITISEVTE